MINGTTGIIGSADNTIILSQDNRMDSKATLSITGRDIESQEYVLDFLSDTCSWDMKSTVVEELEKETMMAFHNSLVMTEISSTPRPFGITASELADATLNDYGVKMDLFKVGQEINKFEGSGLRNIRSSIHSNVLPRKESIHLLMYKRAKFC